MKKVLLMALLVFSLNAISAEFYEEHRLSVRFSEVEAATLGQALGLHPQLSKTYSVSRLGEFEFSLTVKGSASGNGSARFDYFGTLQADLKKVAYFQSHEVMEVYFYKTDAEKLYRDLELKAVQTEYVDQDGDTHQKLTKYVVVEKSLRFNCALDYNQDTRETSHRCTLTLLK